MEELGAVVRNLLERSQMMQAELRFSSNSGMQLTPAFPLTQLQLPQLLQAPTHQISHSQSEESAAQSTDIHLTKREQEVLNLLTNGLSNTEIANEIYLSPRTVEKYVSSLLRKTETNNRAELIRFALLFLYR